MHRSRGATVVILTLALFASPLLAGLATTGPPTPVSPAGEVPGSCPTFSWSEVPGSDGYELVVYELEPTGEVAEAPLLSRQLPAGVQSWTPSVESCLGSGGSYAWSLRAMGVDGTSEWSDAVLFEVSEAPSIDEVGRAIETLRRYMRENREASESRDGGAAGSARAEEGPAVSSRPRPAAGRPALPTGEIAPRAEDGVEVSIQEAVALSTTPSLTVSDQIHLDADSEIFKRDDVFLWDDTSSRNLALGESALASATSSSQDNTAVGYRALEATAGSDAYEGDRNTAVGSKVLLVNSTGRRNTGVGATALISNTTGEENTAVGNSALLNNETGDGNSALGVYALRDNIDGLNNTAVGASALNRNESGIANTAVGKAALLENKTGWSNIAIGLNAGNDAPSDASDNIYIGNGGDASDSKPTIRIGADGTQTRTFIAGIHGASLEGNGEQDVCVDDLGQLGPCGSSTSSIRFKQDVEALEVPTRSLLELEPVSFRYREGVLGGPAELRVGLIAEEVAEVVPEVVTRDEDGEPFGVRYELLSVLLLEELQELHGRVEALESASRAAPSDRTAD